MRETALRSENSGFEGSVEGLSLSDVIQLKGINRFTGCIVVEANNRSGSIFFRDGEIIHAEQGGETGDQAFYRIVSWSSGKFRIQQKVTTTCHTIDESWRCLLLEAHRLLDEGKISDCAPVAADLPAGVKQGEERRTMAGVAARIMDIQGVDYAVLFNNEGMPLGDSSHRGETLAAESLYLSMIGNRLGDIFSLGSARSAAVQGADQHLLVFEGKQQYLGVAAGKGQSIAAVEAEIRKALAPRAR